MEFPRLRVPLSREDARSLKLGDLVVLDGEIVATIGLPAHRRILDHVREGVPLPFDLTGGAFFHLASCSREADGRIEPLYVNPTTSTRFNPYMPTIIRSFGLSAVSGKGGLDAECVRAMQEVGCVYFSMIGGSSALLTQGVQAVVATAWDDLIMQFRLTRVRLEAFGPLTVAIDAHGNSIYENLSAAAHSRLPGILDRLRESRIAGGG
jgi:fumarate hydratase subunit beta